MTKAKDGEGKVRLRSKKVSRLEFGIILCASVVLAGCVFIDIYYGQIVRWFQCVNVWDAEVMRLVRTLVPDDTDRILDAFYAVWGITITVTIFVMQISGNYHFGINMKVIARVYWGEDRIKRSVPLYMLLFPAAFICCNAGWKMSGLWSLAMAYAGLSLMLWFLLKYSRQREIRKLAECNTLRQLRGGHRGEGILQWIDSLMITDMLEHADYTKADKIDILIRILTGFFKDQSTQNIGRMLLFAWSRRIVLNSGVHTEQEKERTFGYIRKLWEQVTDGVSDDALCVAYAVHLLIPFMDFRNEDGNEMLVRVWRLFGVYRGQCLVYLLLYTEYRYWFIDRAVHNWIYTEDYNLRKAISRIKNGGFTWDEQTAWEFWLDWSQCNGARGDIGIQQFCRFSGGMEDARMAREKRLCTPVLLSL